MHRRTDDLHAHRCSLPSTAYFVTCCTQGRRIDLTAAEPARALRAAVLAADLAGDTATLAFTIMPDHVHWLFVLGDRLSLGQTIGKWKAATGSAMRSVGLAWQRDYFEHRLLPDEEREAYAQYVLLNPYRAGLVGPSQPWPHWHCPEPQRFQFSMHLTASGGIPAEWIADRDLGRLATGE